MPAAVAIVAMVLAGSVLQAHAVEAPEGGLATGPWTASGTARGTATASEDGLEIVFNVDIPADFTFEIHSDGSADGTWEHGGSGTFTGTGAQGSVHGDLRYSGSGAIGGTNRELLLTGTSRTVGTVRAAGAGQSMVFPVDNTSPIPTLRMKVAAMSCDEAYGEWAYTVEQAFEDEGFSATIGGQWVGFRASDEFAEQASDLLELARSFGTGAPVDPAAGADVMAKSSLLSLAAAVIAMGNELADLLRNIVPNKAAVDNIFDLLADAEQVINALRNLGDCDRELLGEGNVEHYLGALTGTVQNLVHATAGAGVSTQEWQLLVQIAARTGAIGAGADNPAAAAAAEAELIGYADQLLQLYQATGFDETLEPDLRRVLAMAIAMGWELPSAGAISTRDWYLVLGSGAPPEGP